MISIALMLHLLAAVIWVGGMFFAWMVLRPVAASQFEPPQRLTMWRNVFSRFFPWVWAAVVILPLTGLWIAFDLFGGIGSSPPARAHHAADRVIMILIWLHLFFAPWRRLRIAVENTDWAAGGKALATIRRLVGVNLILGLVLLAAVSSGRYGFGVG
jgi:uncharacterized membrane protein